MTSEDYLKEKLQTAADAISNIADLADIIREAIPKDVLHDILPNSGDNIETVEAFDMITGLSKDTADLLHIVSYGIFGDKHGISVLNQIDDLETHIICGIDDCDSAYPFNPENYVKEESAE